MIIGKDTSQQPLPEDRIFNIIVEGSPVKQVTEFTHLGAKITSDGRIDK